ncbi:PorP/SprF family type IX secretion system membrane protein [Acidiluteibacter ferrifornacis]|uniref:Type IX secretion system membrane protein PorP/SprF n=1 Tax=Acidiluteibacter ferrifornacis TaxID=2692424 RepID=A0A6N9NLM5_9FLAO|nr:PorP/SprF family type IX secretion system membrane protein [Acidiluteibacter ferrifornacis]NBG65475.1 type IX secretion system membrane protein PorP/SprF [Acidiluteibacter ferrifornacis]
MTNSKNKLVTATLAILGFIVFSNVKAQQSPISNFYNFNNYLLNPAEAGHQYRLAGTASHRIQWQGIDGAPKTTFLGLHGAVNDNMGIGGKITVDQTDILKQFNAALSYSYRISINENTSLRFGVSGIMNQNSINYHKAIIGDYADEVATGGSQNGTTFDAEAGLMLAYKKGSIGLAASNLFESDVNYKLPENRGDGTFERVRYLKAYGSYEFKLSENWNLEPYVMVRNQGVGSFQAEVNAMTSWKETLYLGIGYRQEAGYIGKLGFQITDKLMAAYAYEFSNTGIASNSNGSHEFMIGLKMGKVKNETPSSPIEEEYIALVNTKKPVQQPEEVIKTEVKVEKIETPISEENTAVKTEIKETTPEKLETTTVAISDVEKVTTIDSKVFEQKIPFEFEQTRFNPDAKTSLDRIAAELKKFPTQKIIIYGHTCDMGSNAINQQVSALRAKSVESYLIAQGVNSNQISTKAMADTEPIAPNTTIANKQKNRRVEFELVK